MKPDLLLLAPALESVQHLIERLDEQGIIIGGVAVSLLGRPRLTADVDAIMLIDTDFDVVVTGNVAIFGR